MEKQSDKVRFNVGGKIFETTARTLARARKSEIFGVTLDDEWKLQPREVNEEFFIDRNPDCFSVLLELLRTGELYVPPNIPNKIFYREALYYGLLDHVKAAKFCKLDCNRLKLTNSVKSQGPSSAIRASPDGGCAVAHGSIVRVYDWMLNENQQLNLDNKRVSGVEWIDSENILVGCRNIRRGDGGMGIFSSSTGELKQKFHLHYGEDEFSEFAEALCFDSNGKIFASCRGTRSTGIGVWDQVTGKQIDFFDMPLSNKIKWSNANKIQWLNGSNCLFVSTLYPQFVSPVLTQKDICIKLLDIRDKSIAWSMCVSGKESYTTVVDAIPMDGSNSICVVNWDEKFGFIDMRSTGESLVKKKKSTGNSIRWIVSDRTNSIGYSFTFPKLAFHGEQLFCSMNNDISVYYGGLDQWGLTSILKGSQGGSIRDFSIGGDRIFALHSADNVFDVWETPSASTV